jgi:hypothetical protein
MQQSIIILGLFLCFFSCDAPSKKQEVEAAVNHQEEVIAETPMYAEVKGRDTIIIGEEASQMDSILGDVEVTPAYSYKHKSGEVKWIKADEGLDYAEVDASIKCNIGDSKITIIRINPKFYEFKLLSSKETRTGIKTIDQWAKKHKLVAAINAGMYQSDYATNTGFMKNFDFVNNPRMHKDYNLVTAFSPKSEALPPFQIIDIKCQNWDELKDQYNCYAQGIRMVNCDRVNKWSKQEKHWSIAAISEDKDGNALFLFSRTPYSVHDFNNIILELPIKATKTMYLEGGPEASLFLDYNRHQIQKMGSYETSFKENNLNIVYWEIPNIIGVKKKE